MGEGDRPQDGGGGDAQSKGARMHGPPRRVRDTALSGAAGAPLEGIRVNPIVVVLNGPNLNLLGSREPDIYGRETLADVEADCRRLGKELGLAIEFHQSNREYEIIDWIHAARGRAGGIVINPAAFTHTSVAILDALAAFEGPIIEVHISNVHRREPFRHHSFVSGVASGVIVGCGTQGYGFALRRIAKLIEERSSAPAGRQRA